MSEVLGSRHEGLYSLSPEEVQRRLERALQDEQRYEQAEHTLQETIQLSDVVSERRRRAHTEVEELKRIQAAQSDEARRREEDARVEQAIQFLGTFGSALTGELPVSAPRNNEEYETLAAAYVDEETVQEQDSPRPLDLHEAARRLSQQAEADVPAPDDIYDNVPAPSNPSLADAAPQTGRIAQAVDRRTRPGSGINRLLHIGADRPRLSFGMVAVAAASAAVAFGPEVVDTVQEKREASAVEQAVHQAILENGGGFDEEGLPLTPEDAFAIRTIPGAYSEVRLYHGEDENGDPISAQYYFKDREVATTSDGTELRFPRLYLDEFDVHGSYEMTEEAITIEDTDEPGRKQVTVDHALIQPQVSFTQESNDFLSMDSVTTEALAKYEASIDASQAEVAYANFTDETLREQLGKETLTFIGKAILSNETDRSVLIDSVQQKIEADIQEDIEAIGSESGIQFDVQFENADIVEDIEYKGALKTNNPDDGGTIATIDAEGNQRKFNEYIAIEKNDAPAEEQ